MKRIAAFALIALLHAAYLSTGERTVPERIALIHRDYGIAIEYDGYGADYIDRQLDSMEAALPYLGPAFTHRVNGNAAAYPHHDFRLMVTSHPYAAGQYQMDQNDHVLYLYPTKRHIPDIHDILHEFGHAACYFSGGEVDVLADLREINGDYGRGDYGPSRYVSPYAMGNAFEDFAELFATMVYRGGEQPVDVSTDTVLYRKYVYVQRYLEDQLGGSSQAVRRCRAFLGLPLESQTAN